MSELPMINGNFHGKKPVTVVQKMTGAPVTVITGASTLKCFANSFPSPAGSNCPFLCSFTP
jgi:hypothetical protein